MIFTLCVLLVGGTSDSASAVPNNAKNKARLDSTVRYLQDVQNMDGGFGGEAGTASDPDFSAWVALALVAAGINPKDQARPGGMNAYNYLAEHAGELRLTTDFERVLLVVNASESTPHDFGGIDLVREVLGRQLSEGSFSHEAGERTAGMNDTIFAILSLSPVHELAAEVATQRAAQWLEDEQNPDGSWPGICPRTAVATCAENGPERGEVDMTGAAIEALDAAGHDGTAAQGKALEYLHLAQDSNGGFPEYPGEVEPNVASTAWAVQAIWSAGQNPETWMKGAGAEPLGYLESMQHEDGSIQWRESSDANPVWMTAYAAPAFAGQALPPAPVPQEVRTPPAPLKDESSTPPSPGSAEQGQGGESSQPGSGVIAGGGGDGAALFTRPKPQSKGETPGGVRLLSTHREKSTRGRRREPSLRHNASKVRRVNATVRPAEPKDDRHGEGSGSRSARKGLGAAASGAGSSGSTGNAKNARGPGSATAGTGAGGPAGKHTLSTTGNGTRQSGGEEIRGVPIDAPGSPDVNHQLEPGAPGFHSAGAGGTQTPWLAICIGGLVALLVLVGSQLERRRPQAIL